jgi:hypothetical protein
MSQQSLASLIKQELAVLKEKYLFAVDDTLQDPVFDGVVRNFHSFFECLTSINSRVEKFTLSIEAFSTEVISLSEALLENYKSAVSQDTLIVSDCYKMREASNQIGRLDAPHSAASKFKRDLEYNVTTPLRSHLNNCRQIKNIIDLRNRKLVELSAAERRGSSREADQLRSEFDQVDQHLFDWFMILEEYRGDILDSLLQTLKYLEYEFFACSAHAIAAVLPARMEFRPMVEMTPKQLEHQLGIEKRASEELNGSSRNDNTVWEQELSSVGAMGSGQRGLSDYSKRLIQKRETPSSPLAEEPVDILSLSSLMAQGFEEGMARKALRECHNDTQAALDLLLNGKKAASSDDSEGVRMPTTLKRIQRIKDLKRRLAERKEIRESEGIVEAPKDQPETAPLIDVNSTGNDFISKDYEKPDLPPLGDLLFS